MREFKKKYTKNFNKIRKQKIIKSRKRSGGRIFSSLGLGRPKSAPFTSNEFTLRDIDIDEVEKDNYDLNTQKEAADKAGQEAERALEEAKQAAQQTAQQKAQQAEQQKAQQAEQQKAQQAAQQKAQKDAKLIETKVKEEGIMKANIELIDKMKEVSDAIFQNHTGYTGIGYTGSDSLASLTLFGPRLTVEGKHAGKTKMIDFIKTYSKKKQEEQEELLKTLNSAIKKKKELLIKYRVSCNISHPYLTRILNNIPNIPNMYDTRDYEIIKLKH